MTWTKSTRLSRMVETVNMHEAKTQLSRLVAAVENGEEFVIARRGRPAARLVPVVPKKRVLGSMKGTWPELGDDFFAALDDDEQAVWDS